MPKKKMETLKAVAKKVKGKKSASFDESKVERFPKGDPRGGQFAPKSLSLDDDFFAEFALDDEDEDDYDLLGPATPKTKTPTTRSGPPKEGDVLGVGAFGEVKFENGAAHKRLFGIMEESNERMVRHETGLLKKLGDLGLGPKLVSVDDDFQGYSMEYLEGYTPFSDKRIDFYTDSKFEGKEKIAEQFSKLHAAGIFHNDFHSGNVLQNDDGDIKIIDVGLAYDTAEGRKLLKRKKPPREQELAEHFGQGENDIRDGAVLFNGTGHPLEPVYKRYRDTIKDFKERFYAKPGQMDKSDLEGYYAIIDSFQAELKEYWKNADRNR